MEIPDIKKFLKTEISEKVDKKPYSDAGMDSPVIDLEESFEAEKSPIVLLINRILIKALHEQASEIHIEPQKDTLLIRYRRDGLLKPAFDPFPRKIIPEVICKIKAIAGIPILNKPASISGRLSRTYKKKKYELIVNIIPCRYGERVLIKIRDVAFIQGGLALLITESKTASIVKKLIFKRSGLVLFTGLAGSGVTTTAWAALKDRNSPEINVFAVENSIEYTLSRVNQLEVNSEPKIDYATALVGVLSQSPDVILVGDIPDRATAKAVVDAARGRLVIAIFQSPDCASALDYIRAMGIEASLLSNTLVGIISQRILRRVCTLCRTAYTPDWEEVDKFKISTLGQKTFYKANPLEPDQKEAATSREICSKCGGMGYSGCVGVYEVMPLTPKLGTLIKENAPTQLIQEAAKKQGMTSLLAYSLNLVLQGDTTFEEVGRVIEIV